jgi:pimeloyl-ACP methyl ester carboxylesterase
LPFHSLFLSVAVIILAATDPSAVAGRKALDLLLAGKYAAMGSVLTEAGKQKLTPEFLRDRVGPELKSFGVLVSIGEPVLARDGRNSLVSFPVKFSKAPISIQFTLDERLRVAGLYLRPAGAPLPPLWKRPAYSHPERFQEREVTVGADPWKLGGTLLTPLGKGPFPGVVLVHGPGPNDRDESIYATRLFRDLAEGLASRGIAVLRYDKRSKVYSEKMSETNYTLQQETAEDAVLALALLRARPEVRRVFLVAHSLGGYAAPRIAAQDGKLAGIAFLAANARPIEDVALDQNTWVANLTGPPSPEAQKRLDSLRAEVAKVKKLQPEKPNPTVVMGLPAAYLLDLQNYNAPAQAKALTMPLLFLQGERDFQVTMKDFQLWKTALANNKNATFRSFPALNHLFIAGQGKGSPAEYRTGGNADPAVIEALAGWITGSPK